MKKNYYLLLVCACTFIVTISSCKKDEEVNLIEANGLSRDINDFISQEIFDTLTSLGMPINTGGNPANIEGTYMISRVILKASTRENDVIGKNYLKIRVKFSNQNNSELSLLVNINEGDGSTLGEAYGSFIVGEGADFTVFTKIMTYNKQYNDSSLVTEIFSGTLTENGIENEFHTLVLLDDFGDPYNHYIEIGDARLFYDEDAFSELIADTELTGKKASVNNATQNVLLESMTDE